MSRRMTEIRAALAFIKRVAWEPIGPAGASADEILTRLETEARALLTKIEGGPAMSRRRMTVIVQVPDTWDVNVLKDVLANALADPRVLVVAIHPEDLSAEEAEEGQS